MNLQRSQVRLLKYIADLPYLTSSVFVFHASCGRCSLHGADDGPESQGGSGEVGGESNGEGWGTGIKVSGVRRESGKKVAMSTGCLF